MAWLACYGENDDKDELECLDENWQNSGMCRYCWDMDEHAKGMAELEKKKVEQETH